MIAPTLYTDLTTAISIQVDAALRLLLDEAVLDNIKKVEVQFDLHQDYFVFLFHRQRDDLIARFTIWRELFNDADPRTCVRAFQQEHEQLAKLILFLA